mgnify:CR=1 FL=1
MASTFSNWSGLITSSPEIIRSIATLEETIEAVNYAQEQAIPIRTVGSTHSHSPIFYNDGGMIITTDNLTSPITIDEQNRTATIPAGVKLSAATQELWSKGFSFSNQGDVDVQSIAGLIATGVHGTGINHPSISSNVVDVSILTAAGTITKASESQETLEAARLNLGVLGIVMDVTFQVVPRFYLHEHHWQEKINDLTANLDTFVTENDHFEFFWNPGDDMAYAKTLNPHDGPSDGLPNQKGQYIDRAHIVFPSERTEKHTEMEYSVPYEKGLECFQQIRRLIRNGTHNVVWPVEYRTVAADTGWISPALDRNTVTISVHQGITEPHELFFREAEQIFLAYDGRPHWGKRHYLNKEQIATIYGDGWNQFWDIQRQLDPNGLFINTYMHNLQPEE